MRVARLAAVAVAVVGVSSLALVATAGAGAPSMAAPLTIVKEVVGPVPDGTTFTVTVTCNPGTINNGIDGSTFVATFDAAGIPLGEDTAVFGGSSTCTVAETASGGAASVAYACEGEIPPEGPEEPEEPTGGADFTASGVDMVGDPCDSVTSAGVSVLIEDPEQFAFVTVTNTFVEPEPADVVVVQPAFTG